MSRLPRALAGLAVAACAACAPLTSDQTRAEGRRVGAGVASFYGGRIAPHYRGEPQGLACEPGRFNPAGLTAAHRALPCGSLVRVRAPRTGAEVVVRINDRGPFIRGRILDLSSAAADRLGFLHRGVEHVEIFLLPHKSP